MYPPKLGFDYGLGKLPAYVDRDLFVIMFKLFKMLPIYTKIVDSSKDLKILITPKNTNFWTPKFGFHFENAEHNIYVYNISFYPYTIGFNTEMWKQ